MLGKISNVVLVLVYYSILTSSYSNGYPLSTQNRWIIDESTKQRSKLVCGNWAGHLEPMLPEGLNKKPLKDLVSQLVNQRFNCVRLTYAIYMWTRYENNVVEDTLRDLRIHKEVVKGISKSNPSLLKMTHIQVFDTLVKELGDQNVMVLLDNHVSKAKWCCNDDDGNGFFYDKYFDPLEWMQGLSLVGKHYAGNSVVVAMSLRNELHGPRQNKGDWYHYMSEGAKTIHKANPQVLVVVSGLNYDTEFHFLKRKPLKLNIGKKLVYETHLYSWSGVGILNLKETWTMQPLNKICANSLEALDNQVGFLRSGSDAAPIIFSEFGFDESGSNEEDNNFLTCLQTYLVGNDLDWGLWAFQGSYYLRDDKAQVDENFGLMDSSWTHLRYPNFNEKFQLLIRKIQDPTSKVSNNESILYYPLSGQCVKVNGRNELEVSSCETKDRWIHDGDGGNINLVKTNKCLTSNGEGFPVTLSNDCKSKNSSWMFVSRSKLHLATTNIQSDGEYLCLQKDSNSPTILTSKCICIEDDDDSTCLNNPQSQWFQLVPTNNNV
ncbi:hypothetical protein HN51_032720 [Arachis hypogaea]|uniref:Glycoside hydrolase family 5 domain-containing protein n=2 Tax=Arachis hypogaea TaxID=3818 RepID=A0A445B3L6_ARAHY|nr:hypothetical protein Ahy_A10g047775 [Arachis hypogaea]